MSKRARDDDDNSPSKRLKSGAEPSSSKAPKGPVGFTPADLIAQKKAEIAAKLAALKQGGVLPSAPSAGSSSSKANPSLDKPGAIDDIARRVAEAKKRVAAASTRASVSDNPYLQAAQTAKKPAAPEASAPQGVGLNMAAHPLLLDNTPIAPTSKKDRYKPMQPKFASIKANARNTPAVPAAAAAAVVASIKTQGASANPYLTQTAPVANKDAEGIVFEGAPKERVGKSLRFIQKGKYVAIANQQRQEQQLEALKARIAESAKKAGLDGEFEVLEKTIRREPPPDVEWWDQPFLKSYALLNAFPITALPIRSSESPITLYVQHPIPIPPADEATTDKIEFKPAKMTKKEMKKLRKQRRAAELQEKRDRVKMGLVPPDPPKVKLSNMMKVLASDAVADPTKVEARVRREVAMRRHNHDKMNAERKLTDEQRREKVETKKVEEERKGLVACLFRVRTLADPSQRFKVRKNAEQMNLTGLCVFHPAFSVVYVEGAAKFVRAYKKLMLNRIKWTERARPRTGPQADAEDAAEGEGEAPPAENADELNLDDNRCDLIWEGEIRERAFPSFRPKSCPTDQMAKDLLGKKLEGMWDQAKAFVAEEEL
ncbi:PRP3-domain-containing protein [Auricularia subglabra TFB-10046 SS5]|uniref:PRP3-domain-containing protein n=1 Tax=Auricularia subglabra (strain TFB-10046 / SS5) TaxID=717982 RepID=J0LFT0_AURST|nr:PRP3-domain-containing protein [Auricularia subglabra TFB-10046 SS5]